MKQKILLVDDLEDIRELIVFLISCYLAAEIHQCSSGNQAIALLKTEQNFDLIISDLNMPDGSGLDILKYLRLAGLKIPIAIVSGNDQAPTNIASDQFRIGHIPKPFAEDAFVTIINSLLSADSKVRPEPSYIPVSLELLLLIKKIHTPLFIKLNDSKFVKLAHDESNFDEATRAKYTERQIRYLYIERLEAENFISEFKKEVLSNEAWQTAELSANTHFVRLNSELVRDFTNSLGWSEKMAEVAEGNVLCALKIVASHPKLGQILNQFRKIERFGYADRSVMKALISTAIASHLHLDDQLTLRRLTFASLFNDMSLTQDEFEKQHKLIKSLHNHHSAPTSNDERNIFSHPNKAAEFCRNWLLCPSLVDTIIFQHHELPNGTGFPRGIKGSEFLDLSALFIVAEDFSTYYFDCLGTPNIETYLKTKTTEFNTGFFAKALGAIQEMTAKDS